MQNLKPGRQPRLAQAPTVRFEYDASMDALARIAAHNRAYMQKNDLEFDDAAAAPATDAQLAELEQIVGGTLPPSVRRFLTSPAVYGYGTSTNLEVTTDAFDGGVYLEGFLGAERLIDDNRTLRDARTSYNFFADIAPCVVISFVNNEYVAARVEDGGMIFIDGDDGEVSDLGMTFDEFLGRYADALEANES
jgi:hypothetical protein